MEHIINAINVIVLLLVKAMVQHKDVFFLEAQQSYQFPRFRFWLEKSVTSRKFSWNTFFPHKQKVVILSYDMNPPIVFSSCGMKRPKA